MSNELVYGDPSKFVAELTKADVEARAFFDSVVTYLAGCVKTLSAYSESIPADGSAPVNVWSVKMEQDENLTTVSSQFATLTLLCSQPLGTIRFALIEHFDEDPVFFPGAVQGYISFASESARDGKQTAPTLCITDGFLPDTFKADAPASFAEPLFAQLFAPMPERPQTTGQPVSHKTEAL
jgi:hypothetical protein